MLSSCMYIPQYFPISSYLTISRRVKPSYFLEDSINAAWKPLGRELNVHIAGVIEY